MHSKHNRTVSIKKEQLIDRIQTNREAHINEYEEAVKAYREEAQRQLKEASKKLKNGDLNISLKLVTPLNRADEYDKVIEMFNWEVNDIVELDQDEFNSYVHDDNDRARSAKILNSTYSNGR